MTTSAATLIRDLEALYMMVYVLLGLYTWEWITSLNFELDLLTGRKKFKWPMIFYFLCRYFPFMFLSAFVVESESTKRPFNCNTIYNIMYFSMLGSTALATFNLSLRAVALWEGNPYVRGIVIIAFVVHWVLIGAMSETSSVSTWTRSFGCIPSGQDDQFKANITIHLYTLVLDLVFLALVVYKLIGIQNFSIPRRRNGYLRYLLFNQGVSYFAITSILNLLSAILYGYFAHLNVVQAALVSTPTVVILPLLACRMVRGLTSYAYVDEVQLI